MTSIFAVAYRGTFDQFKELFADGDEKRVRWGKSLFIEALSNTDPAQRYPMCDFLLDRDCVLDAGTTDGTNPFHILFAQCARDVNRDVALCRRLLDRGVALGQPDKNGCIPLVHLISTQDYSDEDLAPIYDVVFASPTRALQPSSTEASPSINSSARSRTDKPSRTASTTTSRPEARNTLRNTHDHVH